MKKIISVFLAVLLTVTSLGITSNVFASNDKTVSALSNTYAKLQNGERIHVGYFGGSVTNGYGVNKDAGYSQDKDSWRGKSLTWLNEQFPAASGEEDRFYEGFHAGLGGSGTDLNLYRADRVLALDTDDPVDLLFIEFSINDSYEGHSYDKSAFYMEAIIQKVLTKNPTCDIVIILTTDHNKLMASHEEPHMNAQAHIDVADHYGIPYFWFGGYMYDFIAGENGGKLPTATSQLWYQYFMDGCHPNQNGYAKYCEFLVDNFLAPNLDVTKGFSTQIKNHTIPATNYNTTAKFMSQLESYHGVTKSSYYNAALPIDAYDVFPCEITNINSGYCFYNPGANTTNPFSLNAVLTTTPGASFSATFYGKSAGMYFKGHPTNGAIQYRVDGGEWLSYDLYRSSQNTNEHFMFYENLSEGEHTVDVILRKTVKGSELTFRGFFVDGDSAKTGVTFGTAPNSARIDDIFYAPITITPEDLNQAVKDASSAENTGAYFEVYHLGVIDADVLRYTPNPDSSDLVVSDGSGTALSTVTLPLYKYAVIDYYYDLDPGATEAGAVGQHQYIDFRSIGTLKASLPVYSADKIVLQQTAKSIIDLTAIGYRLGYEGNLSQMHLYPFGNMAGNQLTNTETMNIRSITFYTEYPYEEDSTIDVAVNKTVNSTASTVDLSGVCVMPSAHRYVKVKYQSNTDTTILLRFDNEMYNLKTGKNDGSFTVSKSVTAGSGEVILDLGEIAESGQMYYYKDVDILSDGTLTVESLSFAVEYPDTAAKFPIIYDANGGEGTLPVTMGTVYTAVELAEANLVKGDKVFYGWGATKDATTPITSAIVTPEGTKVYAIYKELNTVYATSNGTGKVTYNGTTYDAPYTTLADAVEALGANGGRVVFSGEHSATALVSAQNTSAPMLVLEGADATAKISMDTNQYKFKCSTEFRNLTFVKTGNDPYFYGADGGKSKIVFGKNVSICNADGSEAVFKGASFGGDIEVNSGYISNYFGGGTWGGNTSGNTNIVFNGGKFQGDHYAGSGKFGALTATHTGNITTTINGGVWEKTNPRLSISMKVRSDVKTTVTGASSLIINNNLDAKYGFQIFDYEYVLKSGSGGKVTLAGEGSATTAPTFLIKAKDIYSTICIDGTPVNAVNGEYLFTPDAVGTYAITYVSPVIGDLDADQSANSNDLTLMRKVLTGNNTSYDFYTYDINANDTVDICDLVFLYIQIEDYEYLSNYTVKVYDDFEDNTFDGWKLSSNKAIPTEEDGALQLGNNGGNFTGKSVLRPLSEKSVNQLIEIDFKRNDPKAYSFGPSIITRCAKDSNLQWGDNYYNIQLQLAHVQNSPNAQTAYMYVYRQGSNKICGGKLEGNFDPNATYRLRANVVSNGNGTTTITATLYVINANGSATQVAQLVGTDTTAAMQSAGTAGLSFGVSGLADTTKSGIDIYSFKYLTAE